MIRAQLDGFFDRRADFGQRFYYVVQLTSPDLERLTALLRGLSKDAPLLARIGEGEIRFEVTPHKDFAVTLLGDGGLSITSNLCELNKLAGLLENMAEGDVQPNEFIHVHLDTYFANFPEGLSDVVIERLDEFQDGSPD